MGKPLYVCVLGSTLHRAAHLICELVAANQNQIRECLKNQPVFVEQDGTRYRAVSLQLVYQGRADGIRYDQIFVDPSVLYQPMWKVCEGFEFLERACGASALPEEFRWVWLDEERGMHHKEVTYD